MLRYDATSTPTLEAYINGAWQALVTGTGAGVTLTLGTSATATNPQRSGDATTGLYSAAAGTVSHASAGVDVGDFSAAGLTLPGTTTSYKLNGVNAIWQDNTNFNLAVGYTGLPTTVSQSGGGSNGTGNAAVGFFALTANTTGSGNTAIGSKTLQVNTTGSSNTAVGANALQNNIIGISNTAVGTSALNVNTGTYNTAVGDHALYTSTTGGSNTAVGSNALNANTTGNNNTGLGGSALFVNTTGNNNTVVGHQVAYTTLNGGSNNILVGTSSAVDVPASAPTTSYNLNIGNLLEGDMTNSTAVGKEALYLQSTVSSVDYLQIAGGATGSPGTVIVSGQGTDTNVSLNVKAKGTGSTIFTVGNVGIGTSSPHATLDVSGFARLALNSSAPATCSSSNVGSIALTHLAQVCVCDTTLAWNILNTSTACSW